MSNIPFTVRPAQPAADWTTQNPLIYQFEIGFESDGHAKVNLSPTPTRWNDLGYFIGPSIGIIGSGTWNLNNGTFTITVPRPSGKQALIDSIRFYGATADLSVHYDGVTATATDSLTTEALVDPGAVFAYLTEPQYVTSLQQVGGAFYSVLTPGADILLNAEDGTQNATVKVLVFGMILP